MAFSDKLKQLMNQSELKAVDLARATGLSEAAISDYINGKKEPRGRQSIAIAKALNVSLDTLWETAFDPAKPDCRDQPVSVLKKKALYQIWQMEEEQVKAVLAFIRSLDEIEKENKGNSEKQ